MAEELLSVGVDVGTTSTQLIVSRILVENRASGFCVPQMDITQREILYESQVHFTPLVGENLVDGDKIAALVEEEYKKAGIKPDQVDTGAVIVTGETSRKENAGAVLQALSGLAGEFVVATAGPDLESVLAAKGAGAVDFSQRTGKPVLHMDIGGGTSNLCYIRDGQVIATGCLNVGGRLVKVEDGRISYVSPVVEKLWVFYSPTSVTADAVPPSPQGEGLGRMEVGEVAEVRKLEALAQVLVQALEMAAGLRNRTPLFESLWTAECGPMWASVPTDCVISFSGGVADCIEKDIDSFAFGDIGPVLGRAIRRSRLCQAEFMLGEHTIRATVIGAGCHSAQLSGSTVFCQNVPLPLKNLPVAVVLEQEQYDPDIIARRLAQTDAQQAVLAIPGVYSPGYEQVERLADALMKGFRNQDIFLCVEQDMAKALGQRLSLLMGPQRTCLCIDRVRLAPGSYLDVGKPVGPCMPVVVKTLILNR